MSLIITALVVIGTVFMAYEIADSFVYASTGKTIVNHVTGSGTVDEDFVESANSFEATVQELSERLDAFWDRGNEILSGLFQTLYESLLNAVHAILSYMDSWGIIVLVLFVVVIVILLAMFYNVAKIRRYR